MSALVRTYRDPQPARQGSVMLRDSREVVLHLPTPLYAKLEALRGPGAVSGLLSELLHDWLAQHDQQEGGAA